MKCEEVVVHWSIVYISLGQLLLKKFWLFELVNMIESELTEWGKKNHVRTYP